MTLDYDLFEEEAKQHGMPLSGVQRGVKTLVGALAIMGYKIVVSSEGSPAKYPFVGLNLLNSQERKLKSKLIEYNSTSKDISWFLNKDGKMAILAPRVNEEYDTNNISREADKLGEFLYSHR